MPFSFGHDFSSRTVTTLDKPGIMDINDSDNRATTAAHYLLGGQLLRAQQSPPPRQYTTVGSVYNPQPQPLQPPVRRGRTAKHLFYPYKGGSASYSSYVQYTPLQQNSDRAVSPVRQDSDSTPSTLSVSLRERRVLRKFGVMPPHVSHDSKLPAQGTPYMGSREANGSNDPSDPIVEDSGAVTLASCSAEPGDGGDDIDMKSILAMNFNSLTNLASYPNPMQRTAQRVLASHRPQPVPTSDPQATDGYSDTEAGPSLAPIEGSNTPALPRARGAPAPLTAGPPGVRQLRPTGFEQDTLHRAREFDDETPMINPYHLRPCFIQYTASPPVQYECLSGGDDDPDYTYYNTSVVDTLTADEALGFYPNGFPPDFGSSIQPVSPNWALERLYELQRPTDTYSVQNQEAFWVERRRFINNWFYSGINRHNEPLDTAVSDNEGHSVTGVIGSPLPGAPQ